MSLAIGDYVYVHREGLYGRIKDIWEREETFYTVGFPWDYIEDKVFEGSELVKWADSMWFHHVQSPSNFIR